MGYPTPPTGSREEKSKGTEKSQKGAEHKKIQNSIPFNHHGPEALKINSNGIRKRKRFPFYNFHTRERVDVHFFCFLEVLK
jgi:hypothetical protein